MASTSNQKDTTALLTELAVQIINQGNIATIREIPDLPQRQADAKAESTTWVEITYPLIIRTAADIIDYNNTFQATYSTLQSLLPKVGQGDANAKAEFMQILQQVLIPALEEKAKASQDIAEKIRTFGNKFKELYSYFTADFAETNKFLQFPPEELNRMNIQVSQLKEMESQISRLQENTANIAKAADSASDRCFALADQLTSMIARLKEISASQLEIVNKIELEAANKTWQEVLQQATPLQPAKTS